MWPLYYKCLRNIWMYPGLQTNPVFLRWPLFFLRLGMDPSRTLGIPPFWNLIFLQEPFWHRCFFIGTFWHVHCLGLRMFRQMNVSASLCRNVRSTEYCTCWNVTMMKHHCQKFFKFFTPHLNKSLLGWNINCQNGGKPLPWFSLSTWSGVNTVCWLLENRIGYHFWIFCSQNLSLLGFLESSMYVFCYLFYTHSVLWAKVYKQRFSN